MFFGVADDWFQLVVRSSVGNGKQELDLWLPSKLLIYNPKRIHNIESASIM